MEITERSVRTGGFTTFVNETGAGNEQHVLLLHGSGPGATAISNWVHLLPYLGDRYHCLAPDIAGFGQSPSEHPPRGAAAWINVWVKQLIDLLDAEGIEKADLVGNSMGGGVSLHLVRNHPDRFNRVVLMGAVGVPFTAGEGLRRGWGYYNTGTKEELGYLVTKFLHNPEVLGADVQAIAENRYRFVMQDAVREQFEAMFPGDAQVHVDAFVIPDHELRAMPHPFLVTHGREDYFIPLDNAYYMLDRLANAQLHVFHHCGHWIQIEQRGAFNRVVKEFLDGTLD